MQNKRDYLLSYSEQKGYSATAARAKFLKYGSEDEVFLSHLIESCKASDRRSCVQKFYEKAANDAEQQTRSKCFSDEVCKKNLVIEESTTELNDKYYRLFTITTINLVMLIVLQEWYAARYRITKSQECHLTRLNP
jgi:hypothetical protein